MVSYDDGKIVICDLDYGYLLGPFQQKVEILHIIDPKIVPWRTNFMRNFRYYDFPNLKYINFGNIFMEKIHFLPPNITHIVFGKNYCGNINNLPKNLTHLTLGDNYILSINKSQKNFFGLPKNLTHLTFGMNFNRKVNQLPKKLTHLTFGDKFNQTIDNLPKNLTHLILGCDFNQSIDNLPNSLTHLTFSEKSLFNYAVNKLPQNLTHLIFRGQTFKMNNLINSATHLTHITINKNITQNIKLPETVKSLSLYYNNPLLNNLPEHIEKVFIEFDDICQSLIDSDKEYFENKNIYKNYEDYLIKRKNRKVNELITNLSSSIKEIIIKDEFFKKYIKIPFDCILTIQNNI
jgi:hypothetical protein